MKANEEQQNIENENIDKLRDCFLDFDEDGDQKVDVAQLGSMIEYLCFPLPDDFLEKTMKKFQLVEDGQFDFSQFCQFFEPAHRKTKLWEKLHDSFQVFDNDGDGKISIPELSNILTTFGTVFTTEEISKMKSITKPDENDLIDINLVTDMLVDDLLSQEEEEEEEESHEPETQNVNE